MATIAAPPHHTQFESVAFEAPPPEQAVSYVSPYAKTLKIWTISLMVFGAALLGSISLWLWYGLQHYQNCS